MTAKTNKKRYFTMSRIAWACYFIALACTLLGNGIGGQLIAMEFVALFFLFHAREDAERELYGVRL